MMTNFIVVFLLSFSITFAVDPCRFEYPGKGVIDLTTVAHSDGTAAFADVIPASSPHFKYSYNPCKPFKGPDVCENVAACQVAVDGGSAINLGAQTSASWSPEGETSEYPSISYSQGERKTIVILQCSTSGETEFQVVGEDPPLVYLFVLTHKCACWDGCSSTPSTTITTSAPTTLQPITDECRFVHPEKGIIDFSFIGRTDEKAAYSDEPTRTASNFKYSYNPCRSFSQGSGCIGAAVCQVSNDGQETFTLGTQESAWWNVSTGVNSVSSLNYIYANKKVSVLLQCSTEGNNEFQAFGEDPVNTFKFQLTHRCACWNAC